MDKQNAKNEKGMVDLLNQEMKELQAHQKQIEEMAKDVDTAGKVAGDWLLNEAKEILNRNGHFKSTEHTKTLSDIVAEELAKMGYRKIPENAVALTIPFGQELHFLYSREHYKKPQPPCIYSTKEWIFNIRADGKNWFSVAGRGIGYYGEYLHEIGKTVFIDKEKAELYLRGQTNGNDKS